MNEETRNTIKAALAVHKASTQEAYDKWQEVKHNASKGDTNAILHEFDLQQEYRASVREADVIYFEAIGE
jgi:hypothetical protein